MIKVILIISLFCSVGFSETDSQYINRPLREVFVSSNIQGNRRFYSEGRSELIKLIKESEFNENVLNLPVRQFMTQEFYKRLENNVISYSIDKDPAFFYDVSREIIGNFRASLAYFGLPINLSADELHDFEVNSSDKRFQRIQNVVFPGGPSGMILNFEQYQIYFVIDAIKRLQNPAALLREPNFGKRRLNQLVAGVDAFMKSELPTPDEKVKMSECDGLLSAYPAEALFDELNRRGIYRFPQRRPKPAR